LLVVVLMDPVAAAIAAAEAPKPELRSEFKIGLPSGRMVAINVPRDLNAQEAISLMGYIALQLPAELAKQRRPGPTLLVPTHAIARG